MDSPTKTFIPGKVVSPAITLARQELDSESTGFVVHCSTELLTKLMAHAQSFSHTEIFGLLLGNVVQTPSGKVRTIVKDFIAAERFHKSTRSFVEVTTSELIRMDRHFEQTIRSRRLLKVGWFHTHPGHGIFMSGTDQDNHRLYSHPWQVALVIDPVREEQGFFAGAQCSPVVWLSAKGTEGSSPASDSQPVATPPRDRMALGVILVGLLISAAFCFVAYTSFKRVFLSDRHSSVD